jgi:hypothetical protein
MKRLIALLVVVAALIAWAVLRRSSAPERVRPPASAPVSDPLAASDGASPAHPDRTLPPSRPPLWLTAAEVARAEHKRPALLGRVVSAPTAQGIAGADLTFAWEGHAFTVATDADGRFLFRPPASGRYDVAAVMADGYLPFAPDWGQSPVTYQARLGEVVRGLVIHLTPATDYQGRVIDAAGAPVAGARIRLLTAGQASTALAPLPDRFVSDNRGRFGFRGPDEAVVEAWHEAHGRTRVRVDRAARDAGRIEIRLPGVSDADLARGGIDGRVLDPDGDPVPRAAVVAEIESGNPAAPEIALRTADRTVAEDDGRFRLADLESGRYVVTASAEGFAPASTPLVAAGAHDVEIRLARGEALRGVVRVAGRDDPVPSFAVAVWQPRGLLERKLLTVRSFLDGAGQFRIEGLPASPVVVSVVAHGYAPSPPAEVQPSDRAEALVVLLERGGRISGTVASADTASPIAGARVAVEGDLGPAGPGVPLVAAALTDDAGRFELYGLAAGLRSIVVEAAGHHPVIVSSLDVRRGRDPANLAVLMDPVREGDTPALQLTGIGAVLAPRGDAVVVGQVLPGGGAAEADLQRGDLILAVDGDAVTTLGFADTVQRIRGREGSTVTLTVRKGEAGLTFDRVVTRRRVEAR